MNAKQAALVSTVDPRVVQAVASRMLDDMPPFMGYFAFTGSAYRRLCGRSAEEATIDATIEAARKRAATERRGMHEGARDFARGLRPSRG